MGNIKQVQTAADAEIRRKKRKKKRRKHFVRIVLFLLLAVFIVKAPAAERIRQFLRRLPQIRTESDVQQHSQTQDGQSRPNVPASAGAVNEELLAIMRDAVMNFEDGLTFETNITDCKTADRLFEVTDAAFTELRRRNPELFWISGLRPTVSVFGDDTIADTARVDFIFSNAFKNMPVQEMYRDMKQAARQILDEAPKTGTDYEKALFVHDYLVAHTSYDLPGSRQDGYQICHTAYGALVKHSAVCMGYAAAYQYLLRELGVECRCAGGSIKESAKSALASQLSGADDGHVWNCVRLDGEYYWVDVTWDDPLNDSGQEIGGPVRHEYCFVDDEKIFASRVLSEEYADLPVCRSMKLNDALMAADRKAAGKA